MSLFSYVVLRDYGFAPNPFYGYCTLATCKPQIRKAATPGDWIIGTGSKQLGLEGRVIYDMQVEEVLSFNEYFNDPRFALKRPELHGSLKRAFGDNIYFEVAGDWHQLDSHHSLANGDPNPSNIVNDTSVDRVLISSTFSYYGGDAVALPGQLGSLGPDGICVGRGHRRHHRPSVVEAALEFLSLHGAHGLQGRPGEWRRNHGLMRGSA